MSITIGYKYCSAGADSLENVRHIHEDEAEILYIKKGEGTLVLGDRLLPMKANTLYFIAPGMLHCTAPLHREEYERSVIGLPREALSSLLPLADYIGLFERLLDTAAVTLDADGASEMERLHSLFAKEEARHRVRALFLLLELADGRGGKLPDSEGKVAAIMRWRMSSLLNLPVCTFARWRRRSRCSSRTRQSRPCAWRLVAIRHSLPPTSLLMTTRFRR